MGCHFLLQCVKVKVKSLSPVWLSVTSWTAAYQAPPSLGFSRQEYWSGVSLPSLRIIFRIPLKLFLSDVTKPRLMHLGTWHLHKQLNVCLILRQRQQALRREKRLRSRRMWMRRDNTSGGLAIQRESGPFSWEERERWVSAGVGGGFMCFPCIYDTNGPWSTSGGRDLETQRHRLCYKWKERQYLSGSNTEGMCIMGKVYMGHKDKIPPQRWI